MESENDDHSYSKKPMLKRALTCLARLESDGSNHHNKATTHWRRRHSCHDIFSVNKRAEKNAANNDLRPAAKSSYFRKVGVAITGGTMVGVGLVMIPLPTPFGCVVAGCGMSVLGKEFPAAQRTWDNAKGKVLDAIQKTSNKENTGNRQRQVHVSASVLRVPTTTTNNVWTSYRPEDDTMEFVTLPPRDDDVYIRVWRT